MSRIYDNWEKLVGAVLRREKDRQLAYCESFDSSSTTDLSSSFNFEISLARDGHLHASSGQKIDRSTSNILYSQNVRAIEYQEIRRATRNFRVENVLGEGSSSRVYKGWIDDQRLTAVKPGFGIPVAVRMMRNSISLKLPKKKWMDEINHLHHPNLLTPIGYCFNTDQTILVYEFMPRGNLDNHLFRRPQSLPWATRINVAVSAARGLAFLHTLEIPVVLVHRNIKCSTIFLDSDFNAKLRDFDATLPEFRCNEVYVPSTHVLEENPSPIFPKYSGRDDPLYLSTGSYSTKSDVYRFGVVLVELISGRRALDTNRPTGEHNLIDWAKPYLGNKIRLLMIMDSRLEGRFPYEQAWTVAQLALQCVNLDPRSRPTMADVVAALQQM